jgi:hypothetical protein
MDQGICGEHRLDLVTFDLDDELGTSVARPDRKDGQATSAQTLPAVAVAVVSETIATSPVLSVYITSRLISNLLVFAKINVRSYNLV